MTINVERQLTPHEEILGLDSLVRAEQQHHPPDGVFDETSCDPQEADHALIVP